MSPDSLADTALERALLGLLLADNTNFERLGQLEPDDLADPLHASVLATALDLRADHRPVNLTTLRSRFAAVPFRDGGSVLDYLRSWECGGAPPDIADVAASLLDLSRRRAIQRLGEQIATSVHDHAASPATLLTDAARAIDEQLARCRPAGKTLRDMPEAIDDVLAAAEHGDRVARIPIGLADLDRDLGGWRMGDLILLGGRPSMGKSALAVAFGRRAARAGHGVMVFSLEMTTRQWMARMVTDACWSRESPISYAAALRGKLDERERETFAGGARSLRDLAILIEEQSGLSAADIAARVRHGAEVLGRRGSRLALVIVDHLGKVRPSSRYRGQKVHEVAEISDAMAHLAKSERVAVLALHQLNRAVEGRENKRPTLADLRDAGNLEQDADIVLFAYRAAYYLERIKGDTPEDESERLAKLEAKRHSLEVAIAKNRNGPTGTVELYCDMAANAIRDKWRGA
jgi:replicative DNA helicase